MVDVTDGADVEMRLRALELLLGHASPSYLLRVARDQLGQDRLRNFLITFELHRELGPPLRHRPQIGRVTEHLRERHDRLDHLGVAQRLEVFDAPTPGVEGPHDVAEIVLRRDHLDRHDGLEELRLAALHRLLEGHGAGDLEGHLARVDVVVRAVDQLDAMRKTGYPASTPDSIASCMPRSIAGMYSFGIFPPTILSTNS